MEISNYMDFQFLIRFLEGLQKFLGDNCEIIVHDYRKGYDHTDRRRDPVFFFQEKGKTKQQRNKLADHGSKGGAL